MTIPGLFRLRNFFSRKKKQVGKELNFESSKKYGIFIKNNDPSANPFLQKFVMDLEGFGKKIEVVCFFDKIVNSKYDFSFHPHTRKGASIWGTAKDPHVKAFQDSKFDFLIFFVDEWNNEFIPFLESNQAKLVVGNSDAIPMKYLDLGIKPGSNKMSGMPELTLSSIKKLVL